MARAPSTEGVKSMDGGWGGAFSPTPLAALPFQRARKTVDASSVRVQQYRAFQGQTDVGLCLLEHSPTRKLGRALLPCRVTEGTRGVMTVMTLGLGCLCSFSNPARKVLIFLLYK